MQVIYKRKEIKDLLKNLKKEKSIGFVPTMGALHEGHISLLSRSVKENDFNVVSIFVNPTQFNDKEDLKNYPRELEADLQKLKKAGCDLVFVPGEMEIYPEQDNRFFDLEGLDENMEGKSRKGHFNGVAQVVTKLFDIVMPTNAYFGEKDFQQLAIIRFLTKKLNYPINIIGCPTLREKNGLAMSSRNQLLSADQKREAGNISKTLFKSIELSKNYNVEQVKEWVKEEIGRSNMLDLEYFEIVDEQNLIPITRWEKERGSRACIAVKTGSIRLIDNVKIY